MALLGGIKESEGVANSLEIENLARFAVDEHNKKEVRFPLLTVWIEGKLFRILWIREMGILSLGFVSIPFFPGN